MKQYLVGVYNPSFCDQEYLRDRDEHIEAQDEIQARQIFINRKEGWLRYEERKLIKVTEL